MGIVTIINDDIDLRHANSAVHRRINVFITLGFALAMFAVLLLQMVVIGIRLNVPGYDGSVYYGSSLLLLHGFTPYHSYAFLQPPGIVVLLTPFALLGRLTTTAAGFDAARVFVCLVSAANVVLLGYLLRWRSTWSLCVGLALACFYGDSVIAGSSVFLEPFLVFATLAAFVLVFRGESFYKSPMSWLGAGIALGLGTSIKIWGVVVFVVLLVPALRFGARVLACYLFGYAASLAAVSVPFFLLAPNQFIHQVVVDQATRSAAGSIGVVARVANLVDFSNFEGRHRIDLRFVIVAAVGITAVVVFATILRRIITSKSDARLKRAGVTDLELASFFTVLLLLAAFLSARQFYSHYGAFAVPFIAIVISSVVARVLEVSSLRAVTAVLVVVLVLIMSVSVVRQMFTGHHQPRVGDALARVVPADTCTLSWNPAPLMLSNRFDAGDAKCAVVLDVFGTEIADSNGYGESKVDASNAVVQQQVTAWFHESDVVVFTVPLNKNLDLGHIAKDYLISHFTALHRVDGMYVYERPSVKS
jgi:hypothetical protein